MIGPFTGPMIASVVLGLAVRLAWTFANRHNPVGGDAYLYHNGANLLAHGKGFINPASYELFGRSEAYAGHPPLFIMYLSVWSWFGADSALWHRVACSLLGTATVAVVAVVGRRLGGPRVGAVAGVLVAIDPNVWLWDGTVYSESIAIFTVSLYLLAVSGYLRRPSPRGLWWVAAAGALAGLARAELVLLVLAIVPLALLRNGLDRRDRLRGVGGSVVVALVLLSPWAAYNQTRFHHPVPLSTGFGLAMAGSECHSMWYGSLTGYWSFHCDNSAGAEVLRRDSAAGRRQITQDDSDSDLSMRAVAIDYIDAHRTRLPAVVAARLGREVGLYQPIQQARLMVASEGEPFWLGSLIMTTLYGVLALAVAGVVVARRARVPVLGLIGPIFPVLLITVLTCALGRYRSPAEIALLLFGAVAVDALCRALERGAPPAPDCLLSTSRGPDLDPD